MKKLSNISACLSHFVFLSQNTCWTLGMCEGLILSNTSFNFITVEARKRPLFQKKEVLPVVIIHYRSDENLLKYRYDDNDYNIFRLNRYKLVQFKNNVI